MNLSWLSIIRLGLVQMALGSIVVLTTSTLNRLMIVESALPAVIPGLLVAFHYGVQITRPAWGFLSDIGNKRTNWIIIGMLILGLGGISATFGVIFINTNFLLGLFISIIAYGLIGLGVGAAGTSLLALLATKAKPQHRAAAATITWLMMIFGIALTAATVGILLEPYTPARLIFIVICVSVIANLLAVLGVWGIEKKYQLNQTNRVIKTENNSIVSGLREIWKERKAKLFTIFVALSMTAYFMQELILEPYAGFVFNFSPGETTSLSGVQHMGVFLGMISVGITVTGLKLGTLRLWVFTGCVGSALALVLIALFGQIDTEISFFWPVAFLGYCNGAFAVAAIGSMMQLAAEGKKHREGTRMGIWGASQALAAGFGGLLGTMLVDTMRFLTEETSTAFGIVFIIEAILFLAAATMSVKIIENQRTERVYSELGTVDQ